MIKSPLAKSINLEEDGLEEEKEETNANYFTRHHHEEMWPVGHLPHQSKFDKKIKQFEIMHWNTGIMGDWDNGMMEIMRKEGFLMEYTLE